jgi:hypothetical protein
MRNPKSAQSEAIPVATHQIAEEQSSSKKVAWWNDENFPYSAPWWLRYPFSTLVFYGAYYTTLEWNARGHWVAGILLFIIGLGLVRELFFGLLLAAATWFLLSVMGAAIAALPISVAIIIGAMIIANSNQR